MVGQVLKPSFVSRSRSKAGSDTQRGATSPLGCLLPSAAHGVKPDPLVRGGVSRLETVRVESSNPLIWLWKSERHGVRFKELEQCRCYCRRQAVLPRELRACIEYVISVLAMMAAGTRDWGIEVKSLVVRSDWSMIQYTPAHARKERVIAPC